MNTLTNIAAVPGNEVVYKGSDLDKLSDTPKTSKTIYDYVYIKIEDPVLEPGWLVGIEAVVETPGLLEFRVRFVKLFSLRLTVKLSSNVRWGAARTF